MKSVLFSVLASFVLASALYVTRARSRPEHRDRDNRRFERGICQRNVDVRDIGQRVPQADRGIRQEGPDHQRDHHAEQESARRGTALDVERKTGKVRGPLHGVPVVFKDNYDTVDLPTTAGSQLLEGHMAATGRVHGEETAGSRRHRACQGEPQRVRWQWRERQRRDRSRDYQGWIGSERDELRGRADQEPSRTPARSRRIEWRNRGGHCRRVRADSAWAPIPAALSAARHQSTELSV